MKVISIDILDNLFASIEDETEEEAALELPPFTAVYRPGLEAMLDDNGNLDLRDENAPKIRKYYEQFRGETIGLNSQFLDPAALLDDVYDCRGNHKSIRHYGPHYVIFPRGSTKMPKKGHLHTLFMGPKETTETERTWQDWHERNFRTARRKRGYIAGAYASSNECESYQRTWMFDESLSDSIILLINEYHIRMNEWRSAYSNYDAPDPRDEQACIAYAKLQKELHVNAKSEYTGATYMTWEPDILNEFDPKNPNFDGEALYAALADEADDIARKTGVDSYQARRFALVNRIHSRRKRFYCCDTLEMHRAARAKDADGCTIPNRYLSLHKRTPTVGAFNR